MEPKLYVLLRPVITFLFKIVFIPKINGKENIPEGRVVLAGNHTNYLDCLLLISSTNRVIHFLAKDELNTGIFGNLFKKLGLIFVNRREKDKNAMNKAIYVLNQDKVIGIFPEGTINRSNNVILPFKYGAVKMSNVTDSYLVPFVIKGKYRPFRKISIAFDKAYKISNDLEKENKKLEEKIINMMISRS